MFSYRSMEVMEEQWRPFLDYLDEALGETRVEGFFMDIDTLDQNLDRGLDIVFTNPAHFIRIQSNFELSGPLATLIRARDDLQVTRLGAAIVTRADRSDISTIFDLAGKKLRR